MADECKAATGGNIRRADSILRRCDSARMTTFPAIAPPMFAGHVRRLAGALVDAIAYAVFVGAFSAAGFMVGLTGAGGNDDVDGLGDLGWILLGSIGGLIIGVVCWLVLTVWLVRRRGDRNGQTLGKQAVGIRARRTNGMPIGVGTALLREILARADPMLDARVVDAKRAALPVQRRVVAGRARSTARPGGPDLHQGYLVRGPLRRVNDRMNKRAISVLLLTAALLAAPSAALATDAVVVPGVVARQMTALDGTLVWLGGAFPNQTLMQRTPDGTVAAVEGAPASAYRSIDLGHDAHGKLVLTYLRCAGGGTAISDDLAGHRVSYKRLVPKRCTLTAAPARWGRRVAYGLDCDKLRGKPHVHDAARSGLFVRREADAPRRLRLPKDAVKFHIDRVRWVDLRRTTVGAAVTDVYSYAFAQTVNGTHLRTSFAAASEGDSDENIVGQSLAAAGELWTLVDAVHVGDPNMAIISRLQRGDCADSEAQSEPGPDAFDGYPAEALAADGRTLYLYVPGTGIVTHTFTPTRVCR